MVDIREVSISNTIYDVKVKNDHALKGYLDEGELLTDAEGLADVKYYNRSTFDLSKFTVVGSPTITDDGIASGFSSSSYVNTSAFQPSNNSWEIKCKVTTGSTNNVYQSIYCTSIGVTQETRYGMKFGITSENYFYLATGESSTAFTYLNTTYSILSNTSYYLIVGWDKTKYYIKISTDNINFTEFTKSSTTQTVVTNYSIIGENSHARTDIFTGSIDLKAFSITVDGKEVFNGNKSGIDQIKADNYTVVGSPTITDDGIASGFSTNNYVKSNYIDFTKKWEVQISTIIQNFASSSLISASGVQSFNVNLDGSSSNGYLSIFLSSNGTSWDLVSGYTSARFNANEEADIKLGWDKSQYYCIINGTKEIILNSAVALYSSNTNTNIGVNRGGSGPIDGSIDLNTFKVYVDGNLAYQPTLRIPYNQSKTGCKIVDSYYRDRVQDMYEQFGWANYYTLSDTDFTLPMGDVYGLFQTQIDDKVAKNADITAGTHTKITYDNKGLVTGGADLQASDIPDISATYYLASNPNNYITLSQVPEEVFIATYNTTTHASILSAFNNGKVCYANDGNRLLNLISCDSTNAVFLGLVTSSTAMKATVLADNTWSYETVNLNLSGLSGARVVVTDASGNSVSSDITTTELGYLDGVTSNVQTQLDSLSGRGKLLAVWNAVTGLPSTSPGTIPYTYTTGDYYIVGSVGSTNYKPTGSQYTGVASTTVETNTVSANDTYIYDGTTWTLLHTEQASVTFSSIIGQPTDNTNLATALNAKQDTLTQGTGISLNNNTISTNNIVWRQW